MADHDPNYETVLRQPAACPKCGALPSDACAKTSGWCEDVSRRFAARNSRWSPISVSNKTVTQQPARLLTGADVTLGPQGIAEMLSGIPAAVDGKPAATIGAEEIAEMRARVNTATPGPWLPSGHGCQVLTGDSWNSICEFHWEAQWEDGRRAETHAANAFFVARARTDVPRLLDAIEALTAENARLKFELRTERRASQEMAQQYLADFGQRYQPETYASTDHGWYATHRAKVEADHSAAKVAKRQAECRNCRDGFPAYGSWPDWHICPMCKRDCRPDAAKDDEAEGLRPLTDDEIEAGSYLLTRAKDGD
jgi:hypothetical protein